MSGHIVRYGRNLKGRDFYTTDIHGYFDLLHEKMSEFAFDTTKDRLFVGGDCCNRGPNSAWVMDYLSEPWFISIRANHEQMVIQAYEDKFKGNAALMLYSNGGEWFFDLSPKEQLVIYNSFVSLPLAIELDTEKYGFIGLVHAEVPYGNWDEFKRITKAELNWNGEAVAQWARTKYDKQNQDIVKGVDWVFVGHTPTSSGEVETLGNVKYCDLGSFFRGRISFIEL